MRRYYQTNPPDRPGALRIPIYPTPSIDPASGVVMDADMRRDLENDLELMQGRLEAMRTGHRERFPDEPDVLDWIVNGPPDVNAMSRDEMVPLLRWFESHSQMRMMEILIEAVSGYLEHE